MKTMIKWILGIVIGLLVVAVLVAAGIFFFSRWTYPAWSMESRMEQRFEGRQLPPRQVNPPQGAPRQNNPPRADPRGEIPYYHHMQPYHMPMYPYGGFDRRPFTRFFPLGLIFGSLLWLCFLALAIYGGIALVRNLRSPRQASETPAPAVAAPLEVEEAQPIPAMHACPSCERLVQEDWSHCPYCGASLHPGELDIPTTE